MFRGRQAIINSSGNNCWGLLFKRRHFLFINQSGKKSQQQLQRQQQFGSNSSTFLLAEYCKKRHHHQLIQINNNLSGFNAAAQIGNSKKMFSLLEQQRRFFIDDAPSSSSFKQQQQENRVPEEQQQQLPILQRTSRYNLADQWLRLNATSSLHLRLRQGERWKYFRLIQSFKTKKNKSGGIYRDFANLALEDGYPLVNAMDALLRTLLAKHEEISSSGQPGGPLVLESQRIDAEFFGIQMELVWLGNAYQFKLSTLKTVVDEEYKERKVRLPIRALPWLRHAMAQMLVEHDGSQQLGPAPPLELPESILKAHPPGIAVQTRRPQLHNNQQQQQRFDSHQKPSKLPSPQLSSRFGQQQSHQSHHQRSSSSFSSFGTARLPQPHNFQKKKPKQTAAGGQARLNNNKSRNTTRVNNDKQPPSPHPNLPPQLLPSTNRPAPRLSQIFHLQQPGPPAPPMESLPESILKAHTSPAAVETPEGGQQQQQVPAVLSMVVPRHNLAYKWLRLDATSVLHLRLRQGKSSRKLFTLSQLVGYRDPPMNFPKIKLEEGYPLVSAMDTLLKALAAKHDGEIASASSADEQQPAVVDPVVLESQRVNGPFFDFQLELVQLGNAYEFKLSTVRTVKEHKEREMRLPIRALPWLRHTLAQMLVEHDGQDGSQRLGPVPPKLPESILKARPAVQKRPQLRSNQRQQQKQQFASHQKPSAAKFPSPPPSFHGQQFHQSPRQSSSSTFGAAPLPQPHNFQKKKPKQTAAAGQWNHRQQQQIAGQARLNNNSRNTTRVDNKQPPSFSPPHLPPQLLPSNNRPAPRLSQIFHLQQPGPPAPPELELLPESILKDRPAPAAAIQTRRPQLHNNQQRQQQKQQFASHQQPSASKLPSPPSFHGQQFQQSPHHQRSSSSSSSTLGTAPLPQPHNFQKKKPKQTAAAGPWNYYHRQQQQPTKSSQQQQTGAGQVKRMNGINNSSLPPPQPLPTNNRPAPRLSQIFRLQTVPADAADKSSS